MPEPVVELRPLDESALAGLLEVAVTEADPLEVMPPVDGPPGWTEARRLAFLDFHRARSVATDSPVETTYVIVAAGAIVGAARLEPWGDAVEAGVWIGRSWRGTGLGRAVAAQLVAAARRAGAARFVASTTVSNTAAQRLLTGTGAELGSAGTEVTAELRL